MFHGHGFWWLLTVACILWYCTLTVYIAIRGGFDIKKMLRALRAPDAGGEADEGAGSKKR